MDDIRLYQRAVSASEVTQLFEVGVENLVPTINSFSPSSGLVGSTVTITGTYFDPTPANNIVYFGATQAEVSAATTKSLTVVVPLGATYKPITVLVNGLVAYSSNRFMTTFEGDGTVDADSFDAKVDFATGTTPKSFSIGDIDQDGKPDLAVANSGSQTVSIFRNIGLNGDDISFDSKTDFATGSDPNSVVLSDIDGDAKVDLIVVNSLDNTISLFRNTSTGLGSISFANAVNLSTGNGPSPVSIGDLDNDGKTDLAVTNFNDHTISVFRNTSTGPGTISFALKEDYSSEANPRSVAIGDLDGDQKPDLVVAGGNSTVSVFRNSSVNAGTISFAAKADHTTGLDSNPQSVAMGDLDGDRKPDLVVANDYGMFSIFRNTGTDVGTISFATKVDYNTALNSRSVTIGDVDGDGKPDLVISNYSDVSLSVYKNTSTDIGTISYATNVDLVTGTNPQKVMTGDLNGDGKTDVAVVNDGSNTISVFRNAFITPIPSITSFTPASGPIGTSVAIAGNNFSATPANNIVFFGATRAEVIAASGTELTVTVPAGASYRPITVLTNSLIAYSKAPFEVTFPGGGNIDVNSFDSKLNFSTTNSPSSIAIGDLDGDGLADLVAANLQTHNISILRNTTVNAQDIQFAQKDDYATGSRPKAIAMGDFDGDGKLDLAVANDDGNSISLLRNTTNGIGNISFDDKIDYLTGLRPYSIQVGDLDGDGRADLVVANSSGNTLSIFRNTSTGAGVVIFATKLEYNTGIGPVSIAITDMDSDGKVDLAVSNRSSNTVSVFKNTSPGAGTISYEAKVDYEAGVRPYSIASGDLDGDGKTDLAVANHDGNSISLFRNTSAGMNDINFAQKVDYSIPESGPQFVSIGDLDGDGKPDLAVANNYSNTVAVLKNTSPNEGTIRYNTNVDYELGASSESVAIGDLNGDNKDDLAVANFNAVSIFINNTTLTGFLDFGFTEQTGPATIDVINGIIDIEVAQGTDVTALIAIFTLADGSTAKIDGTAQVSEATANDFSGHVKYTVTNEDGNVSKIWTVIVTVFGHPVISNVIAADAYLIGSGGYTITATITDNVNLSDVQIFAKKTSETDYTATAISISGDNYSGTFTDSAFGDLGLTFYIEATDSEGNKTTSVQYSVKTVKEGDIEAITELKSSNDQLDYAMIAIPYEVQGVASVFSNLGAHANNEWRLAHYNGGVGYQYYPVDFSNFEPGKGYWFLTSRPTDFSIKGGSAVQASNSEPFTIQLRANDWNMIGNPYPFAIDWQAVIDYNASNGRTVEKLVTYTNRQYNSDQTTLNKYGGALLHSSTAMEIQIPVSARSSSTGRIRQTQNRNNLQNFGLGPWVLGLGLKNESMVYQVSSISMRDGAETGIDSYDWKMLPRLSSYLDVSFGNEITKSVVPIADQFTWDFSVNSNLIGELTALSWDNYGLESSDYALMLLDVKDQRVVDMGKRNFYQFKFEETSRPFKLFYASKSNMTEYMNLESNFVGDPFPNPFSNILTIPVSINGADATVQINVYNILGKEVYQSIINRNSSGYHEFNIDLTEGVNTNIKAGTYLMLVTLFTDSGIQLINKRILFSK